MIFAGLSNALKGISGQYELTRVVGGSGAFVFLAGAVGFEAWNMAKGHPFDLTAWSLAVPGGLAALLAAIAGGAGLKDRQVAAAKATESKTKIDEAGSGRAAVDKAKIRGAEQAVDAAEDEENRIRDEAGV